MNHQVLVEDPAASTHAALSLQQPVTAWPVSTCLLPGALSMQVMLEEAGAAAPSATPGAAAVTETLLQNLPATAAATQPQ